jgi:hypothetical protein
MTTLLLPAISSNAASVNLKLAASSTLLRRLGGCTLRGRSHSASRLSSVPAVRSSLTSGAQEQVVVKAMGEPMAPVLLLDVMGTLVRDPFYEDIPAYFG